MKSFHEAEKLPSEANKMPPVMQIGILNGIRHVLAEELGKSGTRRILAKSAWDALFNRPRWHPDRFAFEDADEARHYNKLFKELVYFVILFRNLRRTYGDERAHIVSAKVAVPASVPYLARTFGHIDDLTDIDGFRQLLADYLGGGAGFEWTEEVSDDKTEVRLRVTKCAYIEILRAYGMDSAAASCCFCDHIIFDNAAPGLYFRRDHCMGVGDSFCDHDVRIRTPEDTKEDDLRYGDTDRATFDARGLIAHWADNYRENGGRFKW